MIKIWDLFLNFSLRLCSGVGTTQRHAQLLSPQGNLRSCLESSCSLNQKKGRQIRSALSLKRAKAGWRLKTRIYLSIFILFSSRTKSVGKLKDEDLSFCVTPPPHLFRLKNEKEEGEARRHGHCKNSDCAKKSEKG